MAFTDSTVVGIMSIPPTPREIIERAPYGSLATYANGHPRVRPMAFVLLDDGRLWSSTYHCSGKFLELQTNPHVEICFVDDRKLHVRIEGIVSLDGGPEKKRELLERNPKVRRHFPDELDPKFVHIEVRPSRIRWKKMGFCEYESFEFES
ncbi:MAG TPA: pyridoxamine 5'-phosphate oxidase family protein [Polyangiaceae bacterium]|nr:MAG: General stress protein 26 [Deltaproteobacteria bacterium ADurb.Bin207]HNS98235.1 pyridoxamine 5'-phosphate oxidase family protein [Polyangiaceae bacterium]HNZ25375.1 pyridoxamine 5'-phosphate oxidase family protein [Polyangiaceae bacterium]HOD24894.1 pyridoxamine 5'-phosphate oxidase family protein [Polyangiaceae bacterium]HOE51110.1 pyridoxamine 5'-phosphate oxidase family protein [Polyangiaceae bacterium]